MLLKKIATTPLKSNGNNGNHLNGTTPTATANTPNGSGGHKNGKLKKTRKENLLQNRKEKMTNAVVANSKNKMGAIVRNRLCSLPGYNLLSENEKKVNKTNTNTNTNTNSSSTGGFSYFNFKM